MNKTFYLMKSLILITKSIDLYDICKENWDADKLFGLKGFKKVFIKLLKECTLFDSSIQNAFLKNFEFFFFGSYKKMVNLIQICTKF